MMLLKVSIIQQYNVWPVEYKKKYNTYITTESLTYVDRQIT